MLSIHTTITITLFWLVNKNVSFLQTNHLRPNKCSPLWVYQFLPSGRRYRVPLSRHSFVPLSVKALHTSLAEICVCCSCPSCHRSLLYIVLCVHFFDVVEHLQFVDECISCCFYCCFAVILYCRWCSQMMILSSIYLIYLILQRSN